MLIGGRFYTTKKFEPMVGETMIDMKTQKILVAVEMKLLQCTSCQLNLSDCEEIICNKESRKDGKAVCFKEVKE